MIQGLNIREDNIREDLGKPRMRAAVVHDGSFVDLRACSRLAWRSEQPSVAEKTHLLIISWVYVESPGLRRSEFLWSESVLEGLASGRSEDAQLAAECCPSDCSLAILVWVILS